MEEFLKENYFLLTHSIEFLAAVVGIYYFKKYQNTTAKFLIFFVVYAFFVDLLGRYPRYLKTLNLFYLIEDTKIQFNYWWYVVFWFGGLTTFITFLNYRIIENVLYKKVLKILYVLYVTQIFLYSIFNFEALFDPTERFFKITSIWMILVSVFLYLYQILQSYKIIEFYKSIYFYINISILLWTIITGPMMFYEIYFSTADWNFVILKWQIYLLVNFSFYLTLILAIIFCKQEIK
ncbi:hypothetical protein [uncultured Winogradskyella sp.]|uniref:hypothetical protein n=1 Tax=uncultured Winogradskyella sp. TaxID=395353 RepID=UPI00262BC1F8|nr:hypothetical protein [uncultured Winogradskyella sp.]